MTVESFVNNPLVSIGSLALAVLGVLLAVVFYFRSQKNKTPCFESASNTLVEGLHRSLDGLEIRYKGVDQERVTISKIIFWNDGRDTIDGQDLVKTDPLRVQCPLDVDILDIQVVSENVELNSILLIGSVEIQGVLCYPITFDYLDHREYIVIQIIHNGDSLEKFKIKGKIKGVKSIKRVPDTRPHPKVIQFIPFASPIEKIISSALFMKYIGGITYLSVGTVALWRIFSGSNHWYWWLAASLCFFSCGVLFYGFRHIPPIKI